jgi:hypothetical protein
MCVLIGTACTFQKKVSNGNTDTLTSITIVEDNDDDLLYINSVKGHDERESIYGNFTGFSHDTLYVKALDEENSFNIVGSNPEIPILILKNTISPLLVNEGDLDGNGTTEIGILDTWLTSSCRLYRIYTLKENAWYYITPHLETSLNIRASGVELAEPSNIKGKIRVRYSNMEANLSSCNSAPIKDTIINVKIIPIEE